jgi:hypothetical protein
MNDKSLKGIVTGKWESEGQPRWDVAKTIHELEGADDELAGEGLNPAPTFRAKRLQGDDVYVRTWTLGCHFPWLNPR